MDAKILNQGFGFANYPSVKLKYFKTDTKTGKQTFSFRKELLFGDYVRPILKNGQPVEVKIGKSSYLMVRARNADGYIKPSEIIPDRVLEVNFIDIGQGDGCHVVTPDDKHFIIDAGKGDNMFRFLAWRFNLKYAKSSPPNFTGIISHSDADHYGGFAKLFTAQKNSKNQFSFDTIYHNGMVEESGSPVETLGTVVGNGQDYITDLCDDEASFKKRAATASKKGNYIKLLEKTSAPKKSLRYGSGTIYDKGGLKIEVLGPVAKKVAGKDALPVFDDNKGKTKNGHSVILKLSIGKLKILLGGDLNTDSEEYLLTHFGKQNVGELVKKIKDKAATPEQKAAAQEKLADAIGKARKHFQVDIAKSCHHGSADFTSEFLQALNPIATVISSGDEEPYCHPRPDTLGTIGKFSRGERSLIFCTELARSGKEFIDLTKLPPNKKMERVVTVYGMINVRSDGERVMIAQKLERPAASKNWDIHKLAWNKDLKEFEYIVD
ncbi:hypothetical protein [uncultured Imperialibacter sp.]|uniref:ComEC/Rec2 family competence protein n=1 Tax=uncultured Imperialibacter sp. TaxID=1672639 RepID=UPI0030D84554|tara:strand:- start:8931 stop:10409 length:1479 start_codon:yes stop_codon:yes gene_type:complete